MLICTYSCCSALKHWKSLSMWKVIYICLHTSVRFLLYAWKMYQHGDQELNFCLCHWSQSGMILNIGFLASRVSTWVQSFGKDLLKNKLAWSLYLDSCSVYSNVSVSLTSLHLKPHLKWGTGISTLCGKAVRFSRGRSLWALVSVTSG